MSTALKPRRSQLALTFPFAEQNRRVVSGATRVTFIRVHHGDAIVFYSSLVCRFKRSSVVVYVPGSLRSPKGA